MNEPSTIAYTLQTEHNSHYRTYYGTMDDAKKIPHSNNHIVVKEFGPLTIKANERPENFHLLDVREQWAIDKKLGVLDWEGNPEQ